MNALSIVAIVLAFICLYNFIFHLIIFIKKGELFTFWFALTCLFIAVYDIASAGLYSADNFTDGMFWQRIQFAVMNLTGITFSWFCWTFFQIKKKLIPNVFTALFGFLFVLGLIVSGSATLSISTEIPKMLGIGSFLKFNIFEGTPGIIYLIEYASVFTGLIIFFIYSFKSNSTKLENSTYRRIFKISFIIFALGGFNDILVGLNVYIFIYTIEYTYLFMIVFMSYLLLDQHIQMAKEIENMNVALAEKVKVLNGLLPICASCKKIRDSKGYWNQIENYIEKHSEAQFSHGICEDCSEKLYGNQDWYKNKKNQVSI